MSQSAKERLDQIIKKIESITFRDNLEGHPAFEELDRAIAALNGMGIEVELIPDVQEHLDGTKSFTYTRYWR